MRFICKKEYHDLTGEAYIPGDVVDVNLFMFASLSKDKSVLPHLDEYRLNENFIPYDELENEPSVWKAIATILITSKNGYDEELMEKIEQYLKERKKCTKKI